MLARRELRVHERRGRGIATQLPQLAAGAVEHPVVAARVVSPDAFGVRENQQPRPIGRQCITFDGERR